jgi:hypothetical protein
MTERRRPGAIREWQGGAVLNMVKTANDVLAFLLELAAIAALVAWGFAVGPNLPARFVLGLGAPAVMVLVWGVWLAPASDHRLALPWLLIAELVVFGLAAAALAAAGHPRLAAVLAVLVVLNLGLAALWGRA